MQINYNERKCYPLFVPYTRAVYCKICVFSIFSARGTGLRSSVEIHENL